MEAIVKAMAMLVWIWSDLLGILAERTQGVDIDRTSYICIYYYV